MYLYGFRQKYFYKYPEILNSGSTSLFEFNTCVLINIFYEGMSNLPRSQRETSIRRRPGTGYSNVLVVVSQKAIEFPTTDARVICECTNLRKNSMILIAKIKQAIYNDYVLRTLYSVNFVQFLLIELKRSSGRNVGVYVIPCMLRGVYTLQLVGTSYQLQAVLDNELFAIGRT